VKDHLYGWVLLEKLKKRQVGLPVCILQNVIEVAHGLMIVNRQDKIELIAALQKEFLLGKVSRKLLSNRNYTTPEGPKARTQRINVLFRQV
jgi:hypothetical protein